MPQADGQVLVAQEVFKSYHNGILELCVLKGVSCAFSKAAVYAIMGVSGSGKTTLLNVLGGIERPDRGSVRINGFDLYAAGEKERAEIINTKISFVFQFYNLIPDLSVRQNIILPAFVRHKRLAGETKKKIEARADDLIEITGLKNCSKTPVAKLSGGEQQRVCAARAFINEPSLVLADEPTGSLDHENTIRIKELFLTLKNTYGCTFVIATHNKEFASCADEILTMHEGRLELSRG